MKAVANFSRYSEQEWAVIAPEAARVSPAVVMIGLRERLEEYGRDYVAGVKPASKQLKFLTAKGKKAAEFRRQVIEAGELPLELRQRALDVVHEVERHYEDSAARLRPSYGWSTTRFDAGPGYYGCTVLAAAPPNAQKAALDDYFGSLVHEYRVMAGYPMGGYNTKPIRTFVAACARPVVGPMSDHEIGERLYRLHKRLGVELAKFQAESDAAMARMRQQSLAALVARKRT
jgi:hypothetical protein